MRYPTSDHIGETSYNAQNADCPDNHLLTGSQPQETKVIVYGAGEIPLMRVGETTALKSVGLNRIDTNSLSVILDRLFIVPLLGVGPSSINKSIGIIRLQQKRLVYVRNCVVKISYKQVCPASIVESVIGRRV